MSHEQPKCVLHPDRVALTTAAQILVCKECDDKYQEEGRKYLPMEKRHFYGKLLDADRSKLAPSA